MRCRVMQSLKRESTARVFVILLVLASSASSPYTKAFGQGSAQPSKLRQVAPTLVPSFTLQPEGPSRRQMAWSDDTNSRRSSIRPVAIGVIVGGVLGSIAGHSMGTKGYSCPTAPGLSCKDPGSPGNAVRGALTGAILGGVIGLLVTRLR